MNKCGQSIVEVIVAIAILAIGGSSIVILIVSSFRGGLSGGRQTEAVGILREGFEATRSIGLGAYNTFVNGTYGLSASSGTWGFSGSSDVHGDYTRSVTMADVNRDSSGNITATGGTRDVHTKKVTTTVSWLSAAVARTLSFTNYISNWDSRNFFHDTSTDFNTGVQANTQTYSDVDSDGAEGLQLTPPIAWFCAEVEGGIDKAGNAAANDVVVSGNFAYYVTDQESAGPEFFVVNITNPAAPTVVGSLELGASGRSISISGQYAYIASTSNTAEMQVVDITTSTAPTLVGSLNLSGNTDAQDVVVSGSRAYLTRENDAAGSEFFLVNISTPSAPTTISSLNLGNTSRGVQLSGSYAYVVTDASTAEFQVINLTVEATPTIVRTIDLASASAGMELDITGTRAYVVTANDAASNEFYVIDISTPASASVTGSADLGNAANVIEMDGTTAMIGTSTSGRALQIVDASTPTAPVLSGSLNLSTAGFNGLFWNGSRLFVASSDTSLELQVLKRSATTGWNCTEQKSAIDLTGSRTANATYVVGSTLYAVASAATGADFFIYTVTNPLSPTLVGSLDLAAGGTDVVVSGNYAYVSSDDNAQELKVINITTPTAPVQAGFLNLSGNTDGSGIQVSGNKVLFAQGATFYNINVTAPAAPVSLGSVALGGTGTRIELYDATYAFVATANASSEVRVINYTANTPTVAGSYNATGSLVARSLALKGTQLFFSTQNNTAGPELFVLSVATPTAPTLTGSLELGADALALAVDNDENFVFVSTDITHQALKVIDVSVPATPVRVGLLATVNGFVRDAFFANDTLYIGTNQTNGEVAVYGKATTGGSSGGYRTSGTYVSAIFDAGSTANWDTVEWSEYVTGCASGDIQLQLRSATTSAGLTTELWQGGDGEDVDETDYFTDPIGTLISTTHNGDRFLQYRLSFSGPGTCTQELTDMTVSYSPY